jgi:hypothetical protein
MYQCFRMMGLKIIGDIYMFDFPILPWHCDRNFNYDVMLAIGL